MLTGSTALDFQQERCFDSFVLKHFLGWLGTHLALLLNFLAAGKLYEIRRQCFLWHV